MRQHSATLERKWNRKLTRPIFPANAKNVVWEQDYLGCTILQDRLDKFYETGSEYSRNHFVAPKISQNEDVNPLNQPGCLFVN